MDLPTELRVMVYEELVVVGKVFYTPDAYAVANEKRFKHWTSYRAPSLAILRVSKQVHNEAEEVYLGKNLFVLPDQCTTREPFLQKLGPNDHGSGGAHTPFPDRWLFSASGPQLIRNISVCFSPRSDSFHPPGHLFWDAFNNFDVMTPAARHQAAHDAAEEFLREDFQELLSDLTLVLCSPTPKRLDYLESDLTNAYCPTGCCRMVTECWRQLMSLGPRATVFLGVRDAVEEADIMDWVWDWVYYENHVMHDDFEGKLEVDKDGMREVFGIVFNPNRTHWEQWKIDRN